MTITVKNIARRPVSLHCNSGRTVHLPPGGQLDLPAVEIAENAMFKKLEQNKLLQQIATPSPPESPPTSSPRKAGRHVPPSH